MFPLFSKKLVGVSAKWARNLSLNRSHNSGENAGSRHFHLGDNVPTIGAIIGCCALTFQVVVLYPWHAELSEQFDKLQDLVVKVEAIAVDLDGKMNTVLRLEEEVKAKEKRILDKEEEILRAEMQVATKLDMILHKQEQGR